MLRDLLRDQMNPLDTLGDELGAFEQFIENQNIHRPVFLAKQFKCVAFYLRCSHVFRFIKFTSRSDDLDCFCVARSRFKFFRSGPIVMIATLS